MVLPASGTITLGNLRTEFGGTAPDKMSEFYRGGGFVPDVATNAAVPTSGRITLKQFYGTQKIVRPTSPSYGIPSNFCGAYSCRIVVPEWSGKFVFLLRRSTDGGYAPFYTDGTQSYLITYNDVTFAEWVGAGTAYVVIWYDQSGHNAHATNYNDNDTQPTIVSQTDNGLTRYVLRFEKAKSTVLYIPDSQPTSVFSSFYDTYPNSYGTILSTPYDYQIRFGSSGLFPTINGDSNDGDWYFKGGAGTGTKIPYVNGYAGGTTIKRSQWTTISYSVPVPVWQTANTGGGPTAFTRIGQDGYSATGRSINGYMAEMLLYSITFPKTYSTYGSADLDGYYARRFFSGQTVWTGNIIMDVPGPVTNLSISPQGLVTWSLPTTGGYPDGYGLQFQWGSGGGWSTSRDDPYTTSIDIGGYYILPGRQWSIFVYAYNKYGDSTFSYIYSS